MTPLMNKKYSKMNESIDEKNSLKNQSEEKENLEAVTPVKIQRVIAKSGKIYLTPITLKEAISKSAKRIKILPNGKFVKDTSYFEEKMKRLMNTDVKMKDKLKYFFDTKDQSISEAAEYKLEKRKVKNEDLGSLKKTKF